LQLLVISLLLLFMDSVFLDLSHPSTWGLLVPAMLCLALHADYWFMRWPLDHLFHSDRFTLSYMRRLQGFGSDHFALLTELVFEGGRDIQQSGLKADVDDLARAKLKADEQGVSKSDVPQPWNAQNSESRIERHLV
jgi:hypothetical protein